MARSDVDGEAPAAPPHDERFSAGPEGWATIDTRTAEDADAPAPPMISGPESRVPPSDPAPTTDEVDMVTEVLDFERLLSEVQQQSRAVDAPPEPPVADAPPPPDAPALPDPDPAAPFVEEEPLPEEAPVPTGPPPEDTPLPEEAPVPTAPPPEDTPLPEEAPIVLEEEPVTAPPVATPAPERRPRPASRPARDQTPTRRRQPQRAHRAAPGRLRDADRALVRVRSAVGLLVVVVVSGVALAAAVGLALAVVALAVRRAVGG